MFTRVYHTTLAFVLAWSCLASGGDSARATPLTDEDDAAAQVSDSGEELAELGIVDFARDVRPILADKCLECHGPEDAKNDLRVDIASSLMDYIEPGDAEGSSLWVDYLITDDEDMRMPPETVEHERRLTAAELATIKLWIDEGAIWNLIAEEAAAEEPPPSSLAARIWHFQGLLHPATVHFPIALLIVSAFFVLLSFVRPLTCGAVAFHCLWIGALGGVVASVAGWAYAVHEGYGQGFTFDLFNSSIDRHRWLGIAVSVLAVVLIPIAVSVRRTEGFGMRLIWLLGSLLLLAGVSITGFQGGELTYGEGHYEKEFARLFPEAFSEPQTLEEDAASTEVVELVELEDTEPIADAVSESSASPPGIEAVEDASDETLADVAVDQAVDDAAVDDAAADDEAADDAAAEAAEVVEAAEAADEPLAAEPEADAEVDTGAIGDASAASDEGATSDESAASDEAATSDEGATSDESATSDENVDESSIPPPVVQPPALDAEAR